MIPIALDNLQMYNDMTTPITKGELSQKIYPNHTYDCALPQSFVDNLHARGYDRILPGNPAFHFVWGYPENAPLPLTLDALHVLIQHGVTI